jgi:hypothetical protein
MTKFAPGERSSIDILNRDFDTFYNNIVIKKILSAVPNIFMVLNSNRQIVFCNQSLLETLGLSDLKMVVGLRPGEIFNCINASVSEGGCGTTEFCQACGAVKAILETQKSGLPAKYECKMLYLHDDIIKALTLEIYTDKLELENEIFTTFHITNIDSPKKEESLERLLFNNALQTTENIISSLDLISASNDKELTEEYIQTLQTSSVRLAEEIRDKQELTLLESGKIYVKNTQIQSLIFLLDVVKKFVENPVTDRKTIFVDPVTASVGFVSDSNLLEKAMQHLIYNALEHSEEGDEVKLGCYYEKDRIKFWIKNRAFIPHNVQLQIFQKSFTTKNSGRGYGTYMGKLIIENYLEGSLSFVSDDIEGTIFMIDLPVKN